MKADIHPKYFDCNVTCGCGTTFVTRSTRAEISVEICSSCHPFYTGKQRFVDSAGRVEKFQKKFGADSAKERVEFSAKTQKRRVKKEKVTVGGPRIKRRPIEETPPAAAAPAEGAPRAPRPAAEPKPTRSPEHAIRRRGGPSSAPAAPPTAPAASEPPASEGT